MTQPETELKVLITSSRAAIRKHIESVDTLPIEGAYKRELSSVLSEVQKALAAAEPILGHLDQVQKLVIGPVQTGVEKAFNESNRWGILGLKVALISLLASTALSLLPYFAPPKVERAHELAYPPRESGLAAMPVTTQLAGPPDTSGETPVIEHLFRSLDTNDTSLYIVGRNMNNPHVTYNDIDLPTEAISHTIARVELAPARITTTNSGYLILRNCSRILHNNSYQYAQMMPLDKSPRHFSLKVITNEAAYSTRYPFHLSLPAVENLFVSEPRATIGRNPKYFGDSSNAISDCLRISCVLSLATSNAPGRAYFIVVDAVGIGSGGGTFLTDTMLTINSHAINLSGYWPYWERTNEMYSTARMVIPVDAGLLADGSNAIEFTAGKYIDADGMVSFDNFMVERFAVAASVPERGDPHAGPTMQSTVPGSRGAPDANAPDAPQDPVR